MTSISFDYPIVYLDEDNPDESYRTTGKGTIGILNISFPPYEIVVETDEDRFDLIFGSHALGRFLCILDYHVSCELANLYDRSWNLYSIMKKDNEITYEGATAICEALATINNLVNIN